MSFESPGWLLGLLLLPAIAWLESRLVHRDREQMAGFVSRALWPRVLSRPAESWLVLRVALLLAGAGGLLFALARPQWGVVREKVERVGVDIVLAIDTSLSMATDDVSPSRFFVARAALASLVAKLPEDRFALLAFEGDAFPLVPLTLDADAVGLFLETLEPGFVPRPGTSLGAGLEKGLTLFADRERRHKVLVLVSDGENLEGEVEAAVKQAKERGIVVHAVLVGTEQGAPIPQLDAEGRRTGFKKDESGQVVVSRADPRALQAIASGTGGKLFRATPGESSLTDLARAIGSLEEKQLAREFSYRRKERFQWPLGFGLVSLVLGLLLPWPSKRVVAALSLLATLSLCWSPARAQGVPARSAAAPSADPSARAGEEAEKPGARARAGLLLGEALLRPRRQTREALADYQKGDHPKALQSFEKALAARPSDPTARFNLADGLYKNGRYDEAEALFRALAESPASNVAAPSRFNRGNALYQKQDWPGAIEAYKQVLRTTPGDADARRNLELSLRELQKQKQKQEQEQEQQQQQQQKKQDQDSTRDPEDQQQGQPQAQQQDSQSKQSRSQGQDAKNQPQGQPSPQPSAGPQSSPQPPKSAEQKERERFEREAGMPRERAMALLDALAQNEKAEQKKLLAAKRQKARAGKDW